MEGFMHKTCSGISGHQLAYTFCNLLIIVGSEGLHHHAHRPDDIRPDMGASDPLASCATMKIRIGFTPYESSGIHIYRIISRDIPQICHSKKRRDICIIHQEAASVAVHLVGIYPSVFRMIDYRMLFQGIFNL